MFFSNRFFVTTLSVLFISFLLTGIAAVLAQDNGNADLPTQKSILVPENDESNQTTFTSAAETRPQTPASDSDGEASGTFAVSQDIFGTQPNPAGGANPRSNSAGNAGPGFGSSNSTMSRPTPSEFLPNPPVQNQQPNRSLTPLTFNDLRTSRPDEGEQAQHSNSNRSQPPRFQDSARGFDAAPIAPNMRNSNPAANTGFSMSDTGYANQPRSVMQDTSRRNTGPRSTNPQNLRPPVTQTPSVVVPAQFQQPLNDGRRFGGPPNNPRGSGGYQYDRQPPPRMAQNTQPNTPIVVTEPKLNMKIASDLFKRFEISNAPDPLPGKPTRLLDLLQTTPTNKRHTMVSQYWMTYFDWARLHNSVEVVKFLNQVPAPNAPSDRILLNAARQSAENRVLAYEIQLDKSQSKLHEFVTVNRDELPPLPSDKPLLQKYNSHYEWYASRNLMPNRLKGIHQVLPKSLQLIADRADTVRTANSALNQTKIAYAAGQTNLASVLEATRIWTNAEQNLVASVVSYNQAIADYSLTLSGNAKSAQQVADMLIAKTAAKIVRTTPVPDPSSMAAPSRNYPRVASEENRFGRTPAGNFGNNSPSNQEPANSPPVLDSKGFQPPVQNPFANPGTNSQPPASNWPRDLRPISRPLGNSPAGGGGFGGGGGSFGGGGGFQPNK